MLKVAFNQEEREGAALMRWWAGDGAAAGARAGTTAPCCWSGPRARDRWRAMSRTRATTTRRSASCAPPPRGCMRPRPTPPPPCWRLCPSGSGSWSPPPARTAACWSLSAWRPGAAGRAARAVRAARRHPPRQRARLRRARLAGDRSQRACSASAASTTPTCSATPGRRRADSGTAAAADPVVAEAAGLEPARLLHWVLAYAGLSAAWTIGDGGDPWRAPCEIAADRAPAEAVRCQLTLSAARSPASGTPRSRRRR